MQKRVEFKITKYYCSKCNKYHYRGKIYENHLQYEEKKIKKKKIPKDKILDFNMDQLRPIARRQISRLFDKMKTTKHNKFYIREINRIILYETNS